MLLGQPSGRLRKHEEQKPVLSNRLLQDSVIILKRGLFMKESKLENSPLNPDTSTHGPSWGVSISVPTMGSCMETSVAMWY